jgi:hypothetical protein
VQSLTTQHERAPGRKTDFSAIGIGADRLYPVRECQERALMSKSIIPNSIFVLTLALMTCQPALAARYRHITLRPERHVIEVVLPPYSGSFIINGAKFTGVSAACGGWVAGDRITLRDGDWNGRCVGATFYNVRRRNFCQAWCG